MKTLLTTSTILMLAAVALAGPPLTGTYDSTDMGGPVLIGHYSESWTVPFGNILSGTTLNAQSWDGMNLGTQWSYSCGTLASDAVLLQDTVDANGNGSRTYMKTFVGGTLWLSGDGPWGNGEPYYSGPITSYTEFETIQFVGGVRTHAVTNVQATASLDGFPGSCVAFTVGNGVEIGSTDFGQSLPSTYPGFLDPDTCSPDRNLGGWWDMMTMSLYIAGCEVANEAPTWGEVKRMYR